MSEKTCFVLLNPASGAAQAAGLTRETLGMRLFDHGIEASVVSPGRDGSLAGLIERAGKSSADTLVAAGGDGTVTAMAEVAVASGKNLAILPLGTANLLARDLGIPLDVDGWLRGFADMQERRIDVATVNDRLFLHKAVIGLLPGIASARERLRKKANPLSALAFAGFVKRRIERFRRIAVTIDIDRRGGKRQLVSAVAVANNAYSEGVGHVFRRDRLDAGKLTVYVAKRISVADTLRLFGGMLVGNWSRTGGLVCEQAETVEIHRAKKLVRTMIDGDPVTLETPLRFGIRPGALSVLAPPPAAQTSVSGVLEILQPG